MAMTARAPVATRWRFEIAQDRRGYWVARDNDGLVGGVFRTREDAVRFVLSEGHVDGAQVRVLPPGPAIC
jgi:hypothetical protein